MFKFYHLLGRALRVFPKVKSLSVLDMGGRFFVPPNNHYVCSDLTAIARGVREPELYRWLNSLGADNPEEEIVFFDIGTSYGQECVLASSLKGRNMRVFGFDCGLYHGHFCALNKALNDDRFRFIFAAIGAKSGEIISITTNSDTHIPALHKKNVPYRYEVMTLALDDFAAANNIMPTHIKIDVDGAEADVLKGAEKILSSTTLKDVFIEIDNKNQSVFEVMKAHGFGIKWRVDRKINADILFTRQT